jgi:hypothetical protein
MNTKDALTARVTGARRRLAIAGLAGCALVATVLAPSTAMAEEYPWGRAVSDFWKCEQREDLVACYHFVNGTLRENFFYRLFRPTSVS